MKIVLLDAATLGEQLPLDPLKKYGEVVSYPFSTAEEVADRLADADIAIINKCKIGDAELKRANRLKLICIFATGFDNVHLDACRTHGVAVCNVKGYSTHSVAQLTLLMALTLLEKLGSYTDFVTSGAYTRLGIANRLSPVYHELYGKTWGVIGAGAIGGQVAKVAEAFGCRVLAYKRTPSPEFCCVPLKELLAESDIISLHTPLNDGTRGLIGHEELSLMKPDVLLINVARGAVTDEEAIATALLAGKLGGFASDVYSIEPFPASHPFQKILHLDNVLLTPHMAWGALEARVRCLDEIVLNIDAYLDGKLRNRVDLA